MRKLKTIYFLMMLAGTSIMLSCHDNDDPVVPATDQVEVPDEGDDQTPDVEDPEPEPEPQPVTEFKVKVNGEDFTYKVLSGQYFTVDKFIEIDAHELDDTFMGQKVVGIQVDLLKITAAGTYEIENDDPFDIIVYYFREDGQGRSATSGHMTIKQLSETRFEATFGSITIPAFTVDGQETVLTDGSVSIDLVRNDD